MIYEKRSAHIKVNRDDLPIKSCFAEHPADMHNSVVEKCGVPVRRRIRLVRIKRKRGIITHFKAMAVAAVFLCAVALDTFVFGGRLAEGVGFALKNGARYALEAVAEDGADGQNTLYTRLVTNADAADLYNEEISQIPMEEPPVSVSDNSSQAVAAGNSFSTGFVDGTRFYEITELDLSADSLYSLNNATAFAPDMQFLAEGTPRALDGISTEEGPLVLILHTHGEECYTEYIDMYPEGEATRSGDTQRNIVRVGQEIADTLNAFGVDALHCTTMHDSESFINAYSNSAAAVKRYLREYPSVRVVVDVHRDAIIRDDGESIKAVAEIAGEDYAQLMFVVGTNELGHHHPDWQDNLSLALTLQKSISDTYPSLCRSINLRNVPFNQQLSSGYLLLEVGTSANTLDEALRSARAFGENLARVVSAAEI